MVLARISSVFQLLLLSFVVFSFPSITRAEKADTFTSKFSGLTVDRTKLTRFLRVPVGEVIETLEKEGIEFVFLSDDVNETYQDVRNKNFSATEISVFREVGFSTAADTDKQLKAAKALGLDVPIASVAGFNVGPGNVYFSKSAGKWEPTPQNDKTVIIFFGKGKSINPKKDLVLHEYAHILFREALREKLKAEKKTLDEWAERIEAAQFLKRTNASQPLITQAKTEAERQANIRTWTTNFLEHLTREIHQNEISANWEGDAYSLQIDVYKDLEIPANEAIFYAYALKGHVLLLKSYLDRHTTDQSPNLVYLKRVGGSVMNDEIQTLLNKLNSMVTQTKGTFYRGAEYMNSALLEELAKSAGIPAGK